MIRKIKSRNGAAVLMENIVFIILNILFFTILLLFLAKQGSGAVLTEEVYAKQIAVLIDSSNPVTEIVLDIGPVIKLAEQNNIKLDDAIKIQGNNVVVRLSQKGGYSYSFFNNVNVVRYFNEENKLVLVINEK